MPKTITIDPVTRIEGHAKITIHLDDAGNVEDAQFHVTQFRGFEKLIEGRPFSEMPGIMARICGICPVSHLVASAKACDALLAVDIPPTAAMLRRIMNYAQFVQSHALSFFHLASPDFLLGMDSDVAARNIFGVAAAKPELAKDGIGLRRFGQQVIETLGGKRIHPAWVVRGGVSAALSEEKRDAILAGIPEAYGAVMRTLDWYRDAFGKYQAEIATFANFPSLYMGLTTRNGELEFYDGDLRIMDAAGNVIEDRLDQQHYYEYIEEAVEPHSYLKYPYFKPMGYPQGSYRVGPLARLNLCERAGTPLADQELQQFRKLDDGPVQSSFHYHYARLIEILFCLERMEQHLNDPAVLDTHVRAVAEANRLEGVGVSEAPRGTLLHHYRIDEHGQMQWANLIIATGNNNYAMNRGVQQVAKHFVRADKIEEGMLNRVEAVIRTYDPCLSCSTHALGQMPMRIELRGPDGTLLDTATR